ncbi:MAG: DUF1573 domain-containing protein [Prevotellaceae bacterium]|jgi:hypothetical protein|nr:DUF1573 domain-containing protein [Prevotellaceae bacterium]
MNKIIKILGSVAVVLVAFTVNAQKIEFDNTTHDFGTISEELGSITHAFKFTNTGDKPLVVSNVSPSCGCTTTGWTKEPVKPGETGEVLATYRTSTGTFTKHLTVDSNGAPRITLYIKGNVTKKPEDLRVTYPDSIGNLRVKQKKDFAFSQITSAQTSTAQTIEVANATSQNIDVAFENVPEYLIVNAIPASLATRQKGQITVSVNGEKVKKFGYNSDKFVIKVGNVKETVKVTSIVAEKLEDSSDKKPVSEIEVPSIDLGQVADSKVASVLEIKNVGNADLIIKGFSTDNKAFTVALKKEVKIKPGKSGKINFSAHPTKGENVAQIYLNTNEAGKSLLRFFVKATL